MPPTATASGPRRSATVQRKILIGIDFGTTYSAIGWVQTGDPRAQHILREWPDVAATDEKAPTLLVYERDGGYRWGFQVDENEARHEWFKLGLYSELENSELVNKYPSTTALPWVGGEQCESLIIDYLKSLKEHVENYINEKYPSNVIRRMPREYIVTVPAIWPERAQNTTRTCAARAGMGGHTERVRIITEPEAAGIYALKNMAGLNLKEGDTFVVCDAGGGTVDLISYTVAALEPVPKVAGASSGSGALCGSIFLNRIFDHWLRQKFAGHPRWNNYYQEDCMNVWEKDLKKNFRGDGSKRYYLPVRGLADDPLLNVNNGRLTISGEEIREIFEPVLKEIIHLVNEQVAEVENKSMSVTAVLLAGGFGGNEYLRQRLETAVNQRGSRIRVTKIENCDTAIVRGALIQGVAEREPTIASIRLDSRIARKHYGTLSYDQFKPGVHDERRRELDPSSGQYRVKCYHWFINKGDTIEVSKPTIIGYYFEKRTSEGHPGTIEIDVFACEDPERKGAPVHEDKRVVSQLLKLKADLTRIPEQLFRTELGEDGMRYYRIDFDIEMTLESASMTFTLIYRDRKYGTVQHEFM